MKSGFSDPDRIKSQKPEDKPKGGKNSPWDFRCPKYDERCSHFVNAGTNYGVGIKNPIGHKGDAKMRVDTLPYGHVKTMNLYENL